MPNRSILEGADVRWDERSGRPRRVRGSFALPMSDSPEGAVKRFLSQHAGDLGLAMAEDDLHCVQDIETPIGRVLRFQQRLEGLPVFGTEILVRVDTGERIRQLDFEHVAPRKAVLADDQEALSTRAARRAATDAVGPYTARGKARPTERIFYPTPDGLKHAFLVLISTREPNHDWRLIVDAWSGEILAKDDLLVHMPDGEGCVFVPNPVVTTGNAGLREPGATSGTCGFTGSALATINAERQTETLRDLTLSGSVHRLEGPYVRLVDVAPPNVSPPTEANADDFCYLYEDDRFGDVMVYYHVDQIQRYLQSLGITTARNSQIDADAHHGSGGAFFSPAQDILGFGQSGGALPEQCRPDRAKDADVVLHEYGHAIQADQVPGWGATNPLTGRRELGPWARASATSSPVPSSPPTFPFSARSSKIGSSPIKAG